jgi:hypothetical protein
MKLLKTMRSHLFVILVFVIVILPKVNILNVNGSVVGVRFDDLLYLGLLVYLATTAGIKNVMHTIISSPPLRWFMIFVLYGMGISLVRNLTGDLGEVWWFHFGRYVQFLLLMILGISGLKTKRILLTEFMVVVLFLLEAGYALLQRFGIAPYFTTLSSLQHEGVTTYQNTGVVMGTFSGHFDFGFFMVLSALFFLDLMFSRRSQLFGTFQKHIQVVSLFLALFALWMLEMSKSRSAYLAFVVVLVLFAIRKKLYPLVAGGTILLAILGLMFIRGELGNLPTNTEVFGVSVVVDQGTLERLDKWDLVISDRSFDEYLFGSGWSSFGDAMDGYYVRVFGELGVIGFVLFVVFISSLVVALYHNNSSHDAKYLLTRRMFLYALIIILVQSLFIDAFASSKIMVLFVFFLVLFLNTKHSRISD